MIKPAIAILFTLVCLLPSQALYQDPAQQPPIITFNDLNRDDLAGPFKIKGFVIDSYKCPPCPPGAMCKPCIGNHVVITDNLDEKDPALSKRLWVFTDKPEQFEVKKQYLFVVKVRGKLRPGRAIEQVELISSEPVNIDHPAPDASLRRTN